MRGGLFLVKKLFERDAVKRKDILRKLADAGFAFKEGGDHTKAYDRNGAYKAPIGRHIEISERIVDKIEKQTGVRLR